MPGNIPEPYAKGFQEIFAFMTSEVHFAARLRELELAIRVRSHLRRISPAEAYEEILAKRETRHGFLPLIHPEPRFYSTAFEDAAHNPNHHRAQFHCLMKEAEAVPELLSGIKVSDYFRILGDGDFQKALDWSVTDVPEDNRNLWTQLFDSFVPDFTRPEYLDTYLRGQLPDLFEFTRPPKTRTPRPASGNSQ